MPRSNISKWVRECIEQIESVLREGEWDETDISDIIDVSASGFFRRRNGFARQSSRPRCASSQSRPILNLFRHSKV
ncbi:hypothetical protein SLA2020_058630 [Shorea laevis]